MTLQRAKLGFGAVALSAAALLAPLTAAAAVPPRVGTAAAAGPESKGSVPSSQLCQVQKVVAQHAHSKLAAQTAKALDRNHWKSAKKDLQVMAEQRTEANRALQAAVASAPANVRAAARVIEQLDQKERRIASSSHSVTAYETKMQSATGTKKVTKAQKTITHYAGKLCGPIS